MFLLRWLLFRLMFQSGVVKLQSDEVWRDLTALDFHYWTQCIPNEVAWYVHQLPEWVHRASCAGMHLVELVLPFLFFAPRPLRLVAAAGNAGLQIAIIATGNYGFFNLLTIALCIPLVDDRALRALVPRRMRDRLAPLREPLPWRASRLRRVAFGMAAALLLALSVAVTLPNLGVPDAALPAPVRAAVEHSYPFRSVNSYGLFRVMTKTRPEIEIEGSNDGREWRSYEFRFKPGRVDRPPGTTWFHMPRLDWLMWFEALRAGRGPPTIWFVRFQQRLLEGSKPVVELLASDPFPDAPPRYLRTVVYRYRFTTAEERARTGDWWVRERVGPYLPALMLERGELVRARW
jgi:hypothetical protein